MRKGFFGKTFTKKDQRKFIILARNKANTLHKKKQEKSCPKGTSKANVHNSFNINCHEFKIISTQIFTLI